MRHANLLNTGASALALAVLLGACSPQTPAADPAAPSAAPAAAPAGDGTATLTPQQWRSLGMAAAPSAAADHQPLPGLAAQAMLPLQASVQVAAPYGGVATQVLVDEGASVRAGQVLARITAANCWPPGASWRARAAKPPPPSKPPAATPPCWPRA